jgi:hypothetical protein
MLKFQILINIQQFVAEMVKVLQYRTKALVN